MSVTTAQPGIKARVIVKFPARVDVGPGIKIEKQNGIYKFSVDFEALAQIATLEDDDTLLVSRGNGEYAKITFADLKARITE